MSFPFTTSLATSTRQFRGAISWPTVTRITSTGYSCLTGSEETPVQWTGESLLTSSLSFFQIDFVHSLSLVRRFPPDTEEKQKNVGGFFSNQAHSPQAIAAALPDYVKALQAANPSIRSWGIIGVSFSAGCRAPVDSTLTSLPGSFAGVAKLQHWSRPAPRTLSESLLSATQLWLNLQTRKGSGYPLLCWHQGKSPLRR